MAKPESDGSYVTIPYFLYEAMARAYYGRVAGDFPVTRPIASESPQPQFTGDFVLSDDDIPTTWQPQGLAAQLRKKKTRATDSAKPAEEA
jgi:hypothetical protein